MRPVIKNFLSYNISEYCLLLSVVELQYYQQLLHGCKILASQATFFLYLAPDFRYSLGLCDEEKAFRKKRLPIVHEAMKKLLGDNGPKSLLEVKFCFSLLPSVHIVV